MAKTEVKRTGYTVDTPKNYLVDAGAIYKNIEWDAAGKKWKGELLGATSDGNKVSIVTTYRTIEVDGVFTPAKGQKIIDKAEATLEVNVKEITAENIRLALNGKKEIGNGTENPAGWDIVQLKDRLEDGDYIDNIALVGVMSGSKKPIIVVLYNALCTSGLEFDTKDNSEAVITMKFEAHANAEDVANRVAPVKIFYPNASEE